MRSNNTFTKHKNLIPMVAVSALSVIIMALISYVMLTRTVQSKTDANLNIFTGRVMTEIKHLNVILNTTKETLSEKHIAIAKSVEYILEHAREDELTTAELQRLAEPLDIIELNVANQNGVMTHSNVQSLIGFDYKAFETTKIYMALTMGELTEISEEPRRSVLDNNEYGDINHYTAVARSNGGFVQLGFNAGVIGKLQDEINIQRTITETKIGGNGYGLVLSAGIITAHPNVALLGTDVSNTDWYNAINSGGGFAWVNINGEKFYAGYKNTDGYTAAGLIPADDFYRETRGLLAWTAALLLFAVVIMVMLILKQDKIITLERELAQKQISIMISQIQPHFLYNSLVVIRHLCRIDPKAAEETVLEFSEYLRGNLDSLSLSEPVPFEKELRHIETYLKIEKKRFGEKLNVVYDIKTKSFLIPALTLQPIVENAVRYGVTKKDCGGTVEIKTDETGNSIVITVTDDGAGFDVNQRINDDGRIHVGIENTRSRIAAMCGGTLEIKSVVGLGTTVVITIPKGDSKS